MTQKTRIAILAPMIALALIGTLSMMTTDVQADELVLFETSAVTFSECANTASVICGERGVASLNYNGNDGSCSFTCNPPAV